MARLICSPFFSIATSWRYVEGVSSLPNTVGDAWSAKRCRIMSCRKVCATVLGFLFLRLPTAVLCERSHLSPEARQIKTVLEQLRERPNDLKLQDRYIKIFPREIDVFERLFNQSDFSELYLESGIYIDLLLSLAR